MCAFQLASRAPGACLERDNLGRTPIDMATASEKGEVGAAWWVAPPGWRAWRPPTYASGCQLPAGAACSPPNRISPASPAWPRAAAQRDAAGMLGAWERRRVGVDARAAGRRRGVRHLGPQRLVGAHAGRVGRLRRGRGAAAGRRRLARAAGRAGQVRSSNAGRGKGRGKGGRGAGLQPAGWRGATSRGGRLHEPSAFIQRTTGSAQGCFAVLTPRLHLPRRL